MMHNNKIEIQVNRLDFISQLDPKEIPFKSKLNKEAGQEILGDNRHLIIRSLVQTQILKMRSYLLTAFRNEFLKTNAFEVQPPLIVQTQVEGGSTLFKLEYYDQPVRVQNIFIGLHITGVSHTVITIVLGNMFTKS